MNGSVIAALVAAGLIMVYLAWKKRSSAPKPEERIAAPELPPQAPAQILPEADAATVPTPSVSESTEPASATPPETSPDVPAAGQGATIEPTIAAPELAPPLAAEEPTVGSIAEMAVEPGPATEVVAPAQEEITPEPEPEPEPEPLGLDTDAHGGQPDVAPAAEPLAPPPEPEADVPAATAPLRDDVAELAAVPEQPVISGARAHHSEPQTEVAPQATAPAVEEDDVLLDEILAEPTPPGPSTRPMVHLTLEAYSEQLNALEEQQRGRLAEAIVRGDDGLRDRLQRELVLLNDRLALIADSYVEELACYQQVLELLSQLRKEQGEVPGLQQAMDEVQEGKTAGAEALLTQSSTQPTPFAVRAAYGSGRLAECRGDLQQALTLYRQAVTREPENTAYLQAAGRIARHLYHYTEALNWLESLVELTRKNGKTDPLPLALAQRELAYTYVLSGQYHKAGPLYKEAMTALAKKLGQEHPEMAISWQQIGELQETLGEYDKAVSLYKKALQILEQKRGPEHPALASILARLAALCMELELEKEAVPLFERLVRIREKALRPTHPQMAVALNNLAEAYRLQGRYAEAEGCYQKILSIHEATHGPEHPSVAAVLQELAKLATSQRQPEEARRYQERASAIFQKSVEAAEQQSGKQALTLEL